MEATEYERMYGAEDAHWWYAGVHDLVLRFARREQARCGRALKILDAGCGTGRLAQLLQSLGEVDGWDIHAPAREIAARRGLTKLNVGDIAEAPLGVATYDLITSIDVLYHLRVHDASAALRNLLRALRPGGCLLLQVPAFEILRGTHDRAVHTRQRFRRREVTRLLADAGFKVEFTSYRLALFFPSVLAWRMASRLRHKSESVGPHPSDVAHVPPAFLNQLLLRAVKVENRLLTSGVHFPLGTSVFAVARAQSQ